MDDDLRATRTAVAIQKIATAAAQMASQAGLSDEEKEQLVNQLLYPPAYDPNDQRCLQLEAVARLYEASASASVSAESASYDFSAVVGKESDEALHEAGYDTPEDVQAASDEELLEVKGIGQKKVSSLRAVFPSENPEVELAHG